MQKWIITVTAVITFSIMSFDADARRGGRSKAVESRGPSTEQHSESPIPKWLLLLGVAGYIGYTLLNEKK